MLLKFEKDLDVKNVADFFRKGKGHFALAPCELGLTHIMKLHLLSLSNCTQQSVEVLPLYILTNLDLPNLIYFLENHWHVVHQAKCHNQEICRVKKLTIYMMHCF